jgi:uncharacterized protein (DUF697 family)
MRQVEGAFRAAFSRAYESVRVQPEAFLVELQRSHGIRAASYDELFRQPIERLDSIAYQAVRGSMKFAGAEGAGLGLGGLATVVPDLGILAAITMRMIQRLSLIYGFEFNTDEEVAELWIAAATAAGVDVGKELLERMVIGSFVRRVADRIAIRVGEEFAEKLAVRAVPVLSAAAGAVLNYYFVRAWGRRGMEHFHRRHLEERRHRQQAILLGPAGSSDRDGPVAE